MPRRESTQLQRLRVSLSQINTYRKDPNAGSQQQGRLGDGQRGSPIAAEEKTRAVKRVSLAMGPFEEEAQEKARGAMIWEGLAGRCRRVIEEEVVDGRRS